MNFSLELLQPKKLKIYKQLAKAMSSGFFIYLQHKTITSSL